MTTKCQAIIGQYAVATKYAYDYIARITLIATGTKRLESADYSIDNSWMKWESLKPITRVDVKVS